MSAPETSPLLRRALALARRGTPVLPLHNPVDQGDGTFSCSCGREDCSSPGKHPRTTHGVSDATTDEAMVREWWGRWPHANLGMALGHGLIVLDVDGPDAAARLADLEREHGHLPATTTVATGRPEGGKHRYFRAPEGCRPRDLGRGLEVRGAGRYVVAPPSRHITGAYYTVVDATAPAEAPGWLLGGGDAARHGGSAGEVGTTIAEGARNSTLASLAGSMRRRGMGVAEIEAALLKANELRCKPPLSEPEVCQIARSIGRYKPAAPPKADAAVGEYRVTFDAKGKPIFPQMPSHDDGPALCRWLTAVLNRDPRHPIVGAEWQGAAGPDGHVVLKRAGVRPIRFEPAKHINAPMRLIEALSWHRITSDGKPYSYKAEHARDIAYAVGCLADQAEAVSAEAEAHGIIGTFTLDADAVEGLTTYGTSPQRFEAAQALRRPVDETTGRPVGPPRYLIDANTGEIVIRVSDMRDAARRHIGSSLPHGFLDARMAAIGWERRNLDGHALPGRAGRTGPHGRCVVYRGLMPAAEAENDDDATNRDHVTTGTLVNARAREAAPHNSHALKRDFAWSRGHVPQEGSSVPATGDAEPPSPEPIRGRGQPPPGALAWDALTRDAEGGDE